jgi:hypothetical protein
VGAAASFAFREDKYLRTTEFWDVTPYILVNTFYKKLFKAV